MLYRTSYHICTVAGERQVDRDRETREKGSRTGGTGSSQEDISASTKTQLCLDETGGRWERPLPGLSSLQNAELLPKDLPFSLSITFTLCPLLSD